MTSFSGMRISLAVNASASGIESVLNVLNVSYISRKMGFYTKLLSKLVVVFLCTFKIHLSDK